MRIIVTVNATRFSLDGIQYFKNYISKVAGSQIIIFNAYDRKDVLVDWTAFGDVQVNGITYGNVANLQSALLPVIYTRQSLGGGGGGGVESVTGNIVDNTDPANPIVNQDQDNLPIPIDLSLADLGLTEVGTDAEMNDALKDYFLANPLAVGEKQILDIRIFDEFPPDVEYNFDITADWTSKSVTDEATFFTFIEGIGNTSNFTIEGFSLIDGRIRCRLISDEFIGGLNLTNSGVTDFRIFTVEGFTALLLDNNELTIFSPILPLTNDIDLIDISDNNLLSFDEDIVFPNTLENLVLSNNSLSSFNPNNSLPNSVQTLLLNNNNISVFYNLHPLPQDLFQLRLQNNSLTSFNPDTSLSSTLADIDLSNNLISDWSTDDWTFGVNFGTGFADLSNNSVSASGSAVEDSLINNQGWTVNV
jgi:hypothetical protein